MKTKRITIKVTAAAKQSALHASATLEEVFQDCRSLTGKERRRLYKLGRRTEAFVNQMRDLARSNVQLLPRNFDLPQFEEDMELLAYMEKTAMQLRALLERVEHSAMLLGSDILGEMVSAYNILQENGDEAGISEALREAGKRFSKKKRKSDPEPAAEAAPVPAKSSKEESTTVEQLVPNTAAHCSASYRLPVIRPESSETVPTMPPAERSQHAQGPTPSLAVSMNASRGEVPYSAFHATRSPGDSTSAADTIRRHGS